MPRFLFHMDQGADPLEPERVDLAGLDAAREHAVCHFAELMRASSGRFWDSRDWLMRVTDETGLIFFTLHFTAVIAPAGARGVPSG